MCCERGHNSKKIFGLGDAFGTLGLGMLSLVAVVPGARAGLACLLGAVAVGIGGAASGATARLGATAGAKVATVARTMVCAMGAADLRAMGGACDGRSKNTASNTRPAAPAVATLGLRHMGLA